MRQIFLDCDGVLADMDTYYEQLFGTRVNREDQSKEEKSAFWRNITKYVEAGGKFYYELPVLPDAVELVEGVKKFCPTPIILTGGGDKGFAHTTTRHKLEWRDKYFPDLEMVVCLSKEKYKYGKPGDILIDDWIKYRHLWTQMGGFFITHFGAEESLLQLEYLINLFGGDEAALSVSDEAASGPTTKDLE